jgi:hypothetical protein
MFLFTFLLSAVIDLWNGSMQEVGDGRENRHKAQSPISAHTFWQYIMLLVFL